MPSVGCSSINESVAGTSDDGIFGSTKEVVRGLWNDLPANGVSVSGDDCTIRGNQIRNVNFGISVTGERALVERNTVDSFAGDGLRGIGDYVPEFLPMRQR